MTDELSDSIVSTVAVSSTGQLLLVGCVMLRYLHVYSAEGKHLQTIDAKDSLLDATWTRSGHIVYATYKSHQVVVVSQSGDVIARTTIANPRCLSVSADGGVIYVVNSVDGVYESRV